MAEVEKEAPPVEADGGTKPSSTGKADPYRWLTIILVITILGQAGWLAYEYSRGRTATGTTVAPLPPAGLAGSPAPPLPPAGLAGSPAPPVGPGGVPISTNPIPPGTGAPPPGAPASEHLSVQEVGALIVAIDRGGGSLNSEQRAKALALLKQAGENIKQEGDAIVAIYQALTEAQRASLATASMQPITPSSTSGPPQPGRDFLVEQVIEVVGKKAGGESKAVTPSPAASPQPVLQDRYPVLAGVYGIQSKGGLSDDQAKAIMGYLITLRVLAEKQYQIETELSALFTADQMALRQRTSFRDRGTVYTTLLSRYLEAGK